MVSLRKSHIDPQLALGSQRLVESSLLGGHHGEGTPYLSRAKTTFRQARSQSFGHIESLPLAPLSSAVSHPSVICASSLNPQSVPSLSSSCSVGGGATAFHSSHIHHASFQPMDRIPDFTFSDVSKEQSSCNDGFGYSHLASHFACGCFFTPPCFFCFPFHELLHFADFF